MIYTTIEYVAESGSRLLLSSALTLTLTLTLIMILITGPALHTTQHPLSLLYEIVVPSHDLRLIFAVTS